MKPFVLVTIANMRKRAEALSQISNYHRIAGLNITMRSEVLKRYETNRDAATNTAATEKLTKELTRVNGRAHAHTYSADDINREVVRIENQLARDGVSAKNRVGVRITMRSGVPTSNAYAKRGRTCVATLVNLERNGTSWRVTGIARSEQFAGSGGEEMIRIDIPENAKADIVRHALAIYTS